MESRRSVTPPRKNNAVEAARRCIEGGWSVVPVPPGEKGCKLPEWEKLRIKADEVEEYFVGEPNVGVLLGEASGGLTDIDLDCEETIKIAAKLLPSTLRSGRGLGDSHCWYVSPGSASIKFKDTNGDVLAEIRSDGHQTVAFGTHPSGGRYGFSNPGTEPRAIEAHELRSRVARIAAAALIARHLPASGRHDLALALSGLMLRNLIDRGMDGTEAHDWVYGVLEAAWQQSDADSKAFTDLTNIVQDTIEKIEGDEPFTQENEIKELLPDHGAAIVRLLKKWFGWGDLTPAEVEAAEQNKRVKRAEKAWADERVRELAHEPDILARVYETMRDGGLVGEQRNAKLLTLVAVTMHLGRPMSLVLNDDSSSGKSYLLKQLVKTLPPEMVYSIQSVSNMGLSQVGQYTLKNKFLLVYELGGLGKQGSEAIEQLKQLLTEGNIRRQIAESTNQGVGGRLVQVEGPTGVLTTSTEMFMDRELSNRMFRVDMDTSPEQTRRIAKARNKGSNNADYGPIRGLHTYLAGRDNKVVVPFEDTITDLIDVSATRMRRDYGRIMDLVEAHAVLHQESRERDEQGRIVATLEDYIAVHNLVAEIVGEASEATVSETVRKTVETVRELILDGEDVTRNTLAKRLGIDPTNAGRRFAPASARGYVKEDPDYLNRKPKRYVLGDVELPENVEVIPSPETLTSCVRALGAEGGSAGNEDRVLQNFSNARSDASVHALSSHFVPPTTPKHDRYRELGEKHHEEKEPAGVVSDTTHGRTIFGDESKIAEKSDTVRASVRGSCTGQLEDFLGSRKTLPYDDRGYSVAARSFFKRYGVNVSPSEVEAVAQALRVAA